MTVLSVKTPSTDQNKVWEIKTDLDPTMLTMVGLAIMKKWVDFALGKTSLGGKSLMHPTGRYASSIRFKQTGVASVAIYAMETKENPEAGILETGHDPIDLKTYFARGKVMSIDRGAETGTSGPSQYEWSGEGYSQPRRNQGAFNRRKNIWASVKSHGNTGTARIGGSADAWVIPAMSAYSPAAHLVDLFNQGSFHDV